MCDDHSAALPRPRWRGLYMRLLAAAAAGALVAASPLGAAARTTLEGAFAAGAVVAVLGWIRGNAAALDLTAWCDCAPATVTARIVESRPLRRRRRRRRRRSATLVV